MILEFEKNHLVPSFERMKKPAPSLAIIRKKALFAASQLNNLPYVGSVDGFYDAGSLFKEDVKDFSSTFYSEMLDLIYSGNELLAWQFFDLTWPNNKAGKDIFLREFKKRLSESSYWQSIMERGKKK